MAGTESTGMEFRPYPTGAGLRLNLKMMAIFVEKTRSPFMVKVETKNQKKGDRDGTTNLYNPLV